MTQIILSEEQANKLIHKVIRLDTLIKQLYKNGQVGHFTEKAVYRVLKRYDINPQYKWFGKPLYNRKNAVNCASKHAYEITKLADYLDSQRKLKRDMSHPTDNIALPLNYNRKNMSVVSRELLANDGVFGADENELYSTTESKKTIQITGEQAKSILEGVNLSKGDNDSVNFSINNDRTDAGNRFFADTRFFGTRGDIAYGDGTYNNGSAYSGINDLYETKVKMSELYNIAIKIVQYNRYDNANTILDRIPSDNLFIKKAKKAIYSILFDNQISREEKLNNLRGSLNRINNDINIYKGKFDRVNATIKTGKRGRPRKVSDDTIMPRYDVGLVPNTNVKLIALFELTDFNFSDAIKHGKLRTNDDITKITGVRKEINKFGKGKSPIERTNVTYDDNVTPDIASNFSLKGIETNPFNLDSNKGHYKQQYEYNDKTYTSVAQFMDKSIMCAAYALKKENVKIDYILDAPSSSKFNHYYCTNLANKLGVEYRMNFFQRNMLNVSIDENGMRKNGINENVIVKTKNTLKNVAIAEITSYMNECVVKFVNDNFAYLSNISLEKMSRNKVDANLLIDIIRNQAYYGLINIKRDNPKTSNLYMYLVNHFGQYSYNRTSTKFNVKHISNELSKILKTKLSRRYQILLGEIDRITSTYESQLLSNGMKISDSQKFKITNIDENVRPYIKNAYIIADSEMAHNSNGVMDKLRSSLMNKYFLIIDEDVQSGATLQLLINALKEKELECGFMNTGRGRPKRQFIQDSQITCLVNAIKK